MPEWLTALICLSIVIVAILITGLIKVIMKKAAERKGEELDCKKYEYLFAAISLLLSAAGVFCFLKFAAKITDMNLILKATISYAGLVQTVYLFIVQLIRKGWVGIVNGIKNLINKTKDSENPIEELPKIIKDETKTEQPTEAEDEAVSRLKDEFIKVIKNSK